MTREQIETRLADIADISGDCEQAHGAEDDLRESVLDAIAKGTLDGIGPAEAAELALRTRDIEFDRWYA